jgi:hypothetical protein
VYRGDLEGKRGEELPFTRERSRNRLRVSINTGFRGGNKANKLIKLELPCFSPIYVHFKALISVIAVQPCNLPYAD